MKLLRHVVEPARPCVYLPTERASLETRVMIDVEPAELDAMLSRGWRRFGPCYFRPRCVGCAACVSLRIPVADFVPSRSQRRAERAFASFRAEVGVPIVDDARLALYAKWHAMREETRAWEAAPLDPGSYALQFAFPHPSAREIAWYDGDRLVALSITDETPRALSAVFFFYDPDVADRSPGVANVLFHVALARKRKLSHVYLGYRVLGCRSMEYKARYAPHELLEGRPNDDEEPRWIRSE